MFSSIFYLRLLLFALPGLIELVQSCGWRLRQTKMIMNGLLALQLIVK